MSIETARTIGDDASEALQGAIDALMRRAAPRFASRVSMLESGPDGRILATAENVGRVTAILESMRAVLFDDEYLAAVADYVENLNRVSAAVTAGLREFGADEEVLRAIAKRSKLVAASALLDPASFRDLFGAISAQLTNGIATAAPVSSVIDGVRQVTEG